MKTKQTQVFLPISIWVPAQLYALLTFVWQRTVKPRQMPSLQITNVTHMHENTHTLAQPDNTHWTSNAQRVKKFEGLGGIQFRFDVFNSCVELHVRRLWICTLKFLLQGQDRADKWLHCILLFNLSTTSFFTTFMNFIWSIIYYGCISGMKWLGAGDVPHTVSSLS